MHVHCAMFIIHQNTCFIIKFKQIEGLNETNESCENLLKNQVKVFDSLAQHQAISFSQFQLFHNKQHLTRRKQVPFRLY